MTVLFQVFNALVKPITHAKVCIFQYIFFSILKYHDSNLHTTSFKQSFHKNTYLKCQSSIRFRARVFDIFLAELLIKGNVNSFNNMTKKQTDKRFPAVFHFQEFVVGDFHNIYNAFIFINVQFFSDGSITIAFHKILFSKKQHAMV